MQFTTVSIVSIHDSVFCQIVEVDGVIFLIPTLNCDRMSLSKVNFSVLKSFKRVRRYNIHFNQNIFDKGIDTQQHAWLLGIAYGDGSIMSHKKYSDQSAAFKLQLQLADVDVINNVRHIMQSDHFVSVCWPAKRITQRPSTYLCVSNSHFANTLRDLGCMHNKSDKILFPSDIVPEKCMWDFIRGYYEADGSQTLDLNGRCRIEFHCQSYGFLVGLRDFISNTLKVTYSAINKGQKNSYHLQWGATNDVILITKMMYHQHCDHITRMNRKFNKHTMFTTCKGIPLKQRRIIFNKFKLQQMKHELHIVSRMIQSLANAIANNSRIFEQYHFCNSWLALLEKNVLNADGYLRTDWQTSLRLLCSNWRYNEKLREISDKEAFDTCGE